MSSHHPHLAASTDPTFVAKARTTGEILRRIAVYLRPYKLMAAATIGCAIFSLACAFAYPKLTQFAIDDVIGKRDAAKLAPVMLGLLGAFLLREVFNSLRVRVNNEFEQKVILDIRRDVYSRLQRLPVGWFDQRASGDLMTRVIDDVNSVERVLIDGTEQGTVAILSIVGTLVILFWTSPLLASVALVPLPFLIGGALWYTLTAHRRYRAQRQAASAMNALLMDNLQGIRQIKAFGREAHEDARFAQRANDLRLGTLSVMRVWSIYSPAMALASALGTGLVLWVGGGLVIRGALTVGELVGFVFYLSLFYEPIGRLHGLNQMMQSARAAGERVFDIFDATEENPGVRPGTAASAPAPVSQTSKSAVSQVSKPADARPSGTPRPDSRARNSAAPADLEIGDTAGLETCATGAPAPVPQTSQSAVSQVSKPADARPSGTPRLDPRARNSAAPADLEIGDTAGLETCATGPAPAAPLTSWRASGEVVYENVGFSYGPERVVLKNISLHARPGEMIALVGPTGAGKSTLVNLLPAFYVATAGRLAIDGRDTRELSLAALRTQISVVSQEAFLFNGTVRENILYGRLDATDAELIAAATAANCHEFISRLPEGYDARVGERGVKLSVGEKQRVSIARALLKDAPILILDEATASVDTQTERLIQQALERLMTGRTSFVIAHRLSTIRNADQILVMRHGEIIERGRHDELLSRDGLYAKLARIQNTTFIEESFAKLVEA